MHTYAPKRRDGFNSPGIQCALALILTFSPMAIYAFDYNSYEHYSFANCSLDTTGAPDAIYCDIPTGDDGRSPKNMSGLTFYSKDFAGYVAVCVRHVDVGLEKCTWQYVQPDGKVVFDTPDLNFNWASAASWGGGTEWWNWVEYIFLWDAGISPSSALQGYKVFYDIP